jgi:predicted RNase H-like nuclease (RuvC/YqgF family)
MTLTTSIIYYLMALTGKINGLLGTMENSTNLLLIPITLIVIAFVCRWHTAFVESQIMASNERLMVIIEELQSDLDTAKNDLTVADAAIEELKPVTLDPYIANQKLESQLKEQDRTISNLKVQIEGRDAALRGSTIEYKKLYQQIQILQENLTRSNSDRLSELTSIMRMVQALESIPIQQGLGAIDLIKRVIYDAICKLDPSQAVES